MNDVLQRALQYIRNTGGKPTIQMFDEDHEPIGPMLRKDLLEADLITVIQDVIQVKP